jgi:formylglycine-generating enzyme required for sulfatase activity
MVVVPAGSFTMGSPASEAGRTNDEGPHRTVTIRQPFALGKFEVTFAEWEACVAHGGCPGNRSPGDGGWGKGQQPVINVSWDDAKQYVAWLSKKTGKSYRLLTEAEWEYAARAGGGGRWTFGDDEWRLVEYGWYSANSGIATQPVGGKAANAFGLHDMHGNVWEWVEDCWHDSYNGAPSDGAAWTTACTDGSRRVLRGGSWELSPQNLRSALRFWNSTDFRDFNLGFRVGRTF